MITTRSELIEYCLRQLGHPVIQINVAEEQCLDRVEDALQKYYEFHGDGSQRFYLKHVITDADVTNGSIDLPENVMSVVEVLNLGFYGALNMNNLSHVAHITDIVSGLSREGLGSYTRAMSYLKTIENVLSPDKSVRFVKYGNKLRFDGSEFGKAGDMIVIKCYIANTEEDLPKTLNDYWLRRYTTALIKKQWANNLIKYNGFQLPSGITIDGSTILSEANSDIEALETELRDVWEDPIMPMIG